MQRLTSSQIGCGPGSSPAALHEATPCLSAIRQLEVALVAMPKIEPIHVICAGMMRSASTWSYNVCLEILRAAGGDPVGAHSASFEKTYSELDDPSRSLVFKAHALDRLALEMLGSGPLKAVCTHRNPLDAMVSGTALLGFTFEEMLNQLEASVQAMVQILDHSGPVLFIAYEDLMADANPQVVRIAEFLEVDLPGSALTEVAARTSLQAMRAIADNFAALDDQRVVSGPGPWAYDRQTLLHPHHIQDAETGKGFRQLTAAQQELVHSRVRTPLSRVGRVIP